LAHRIVSGVRMLSGTIVQSHVSADRRVLPTMATPRRSTTVSLMLAA